MERPVVNAAQSLRSACKEEEAIMLAPREFSHTTNDPDEWRPIATAPFDRDLELAVINYYGVHTLIFPCRRILTGWLKSGTQEQVNVLPTHWREWEDARSALFSLVPTLKRGSNF